MEKKISLWVSLILGIPILRVVEVFGVSYAAGNVRVDSMLVQHVALGLIIGIGCTIAGHAMKITDRRVLWFMPTCAVLYAAVLLWMSYPARFFHQDPAFVSSLILMDLGSWTIAVFGASMVGYAASRPRAQVASPVAISAGHPTV